jgi:hypothetical protein
MKTEPVKVHFNNPVCMYGLYICTASENYHCKPIQALDWHDWKKQAIARANHCSYRGLELTPTEHDTRWMNIKKG